MDNSSQRIYAQVCLKSGLNFIPGQCLYIVTGPGNYAFARVLAEEAYAFGAKYVEIGIKDPYLVRARIKHGSSEDWTYLPDYIKNLHDVNLEEQWCRIRIEETEDTVLLSDCDPEALKTIDTTLKEKTVDYIDAMMRHQLPWLVITYPSLAWAKSALGDGHSSLSDEELYELFEKQFNSILRLDNSDPIKAWKDHSESLDQRAHRLNSMKIDSLHFKAEGTDLRVGLLSTSLWEGGGTILPDGRETMPNLPTEEVFTTPDYSRTNGRVKITRPLRVMEVLVDGAWFQFKDGVVVDFGASKGQEVLEKYLNVDEGAKRLGEVALVDSESPIFKTGLFFNSVLFDENASCHIALGAGYPSNLSNAKDLKNNEELLQAGCNVSLVHRDFMIGSDDLVVEALLENDEVVSIIKNGKFVID